VLLCLLGLYTATVAIDLSIGLFTLSTYSCSCLVMSFHYRVIQNKMLQHKNNDICVVQKYFLQQSFFVNLAHTTQYFVRLFCLILRHQVNTSIWRNGIKHQIQRSIVASQQRKVSHFTQIYYAEKNTVLNHPITYN